MTVKIAYGAGHGLHTAGKRTLKAIDPKETREWTLNERIVRYIQEGLKGYEGYEFLRVDDPTGRLDTPLATRVRKVNNFNPDIYVSVHHNAGIGGGSGGGISNFVQVNATRVEKDYQTKMYNSLIKHTGLKGNRASPLREIPFYVLRNTKVPAMLVEHGFMDSTVDTPIILTDDFARKAANAHVDFLVTEFKLKKKQGTVAPKPEVELYRVRKAWDDPKSQDGAYEMIENAIRKVDSLPGYKAFNLKGEVVYPKPPTKPTPTPSTGLKYNAGERVTVDGVLHKNADGVGPGSHYRGNNVIQYIAPGKNYPYHIANIGWVNEAAIKPYKVPVKEKVKEDYVVLLKEAGTWGIYRLNTYPVAKNIFARLNPGKHGDLTYKILGRPYANTVTIQTRDFGRVNVWIGAGTPHKIIKK